MKPCDHFFSRFRPLVHIPLIFGGVILMAGLAFLFGVIVMLLWNWLMPEIFGLGTITYWQAWGLVILSHILFKAGSWHHDHDHNKKKSGNGMRAEFRKKFRKAFEKEFDKEFEKEESKDREEDIAEKTDESSTDKSGTSSTENEKETE